MSVVKTSVYVTQDNLFIYVGMVSTMVGHRPEVITTANIEDASPISNIQFRERRYVHDHFPNVREIAVTITRTVIIDTEELNFNLPPVTTPDS